MNKKQYTAPCTEIDYMEPLYVIAASEPEEENKIQSAGDDDGSGVAETNIIKLFDDTLD